MKDLLEVVDKKIKYREATKILTTTEAPTQVVLKSVCSEKSYPVNKKRILYSSIRHNPKCRPSGKDVSKKGVVTNE